jgi:hypothetical protein
MTMPVAFSLKNQKSGRVPNYLVGGHHTLIVSSDQ